MTLICVLSNSDDEVDPAMCPRGDNYPLRTFIDFNDFPSQPARAIDVLRESNEMTRASGFEDAVLDKPEFCMCIAAFRDNPITSRRDFHNALLKSILWWDEDYVLPAVDIFCRAVLQQATNAFFFAHCDGRTLPLIMRLRNLMNSAKDQRVKFIIIRGLCNAFSHKAGELALCDKISELTTELLQVFDACEGHKHVQTAVASFVANFAKAAFRDESRRDQRAVIVRIVVEYLKKMCLTRRFKMDAGAVSIFQRALITLVWGDRQLIQVAKECGVLQVASDFDDAYPNEEIKIQSMQIRDMVRALP
ncbi:hypothetical protein QR680_016170 [Steinernema hermaphroditum]|uniref:PUL domain-containing protein n=1 Tax=Steinernema hermaphroditum TaxID=289476 RepID=A0AA39HC86_9BILA|nr:hypothetical protein QR680_016170 [Steinernema hermaphroditum]